MPHARSWAPTATSRPKGREPRRAIFIVWVIYEAITGKDRLDFPELPADWRTRPDFDQLLEFNEILTKACDGDPHERYKSTEGMQADLALLHTGQSVKRRRTLKQRWVIVRKLALAVAALATGVG